MVSSDTSNRILAQHTQMVRDAMLCQENKEMNNFRLFYGRAQGLELAMQSLGIPFKPIHMTSRTST